MVGQAHSVLHLGVFSQKQGYSWRLNWGWMPQKFVWHHCNAFPLMLWFLSPMRKCTSSLLLSSLSLDCISYLLTQHWSITTCPNWVEEFSIQRYRDTQLLKDPLMPQENSIFAWGKGGIHIGCIYIHSLEWYIHIFLVFLSQNCLVFKNFPPCPPSFTKTLGSPYCTCLSWYQGENTSF